MSIFATIEIISFIKRIICLINNVNADQLTLVAGEKSDLAYTYIGSLVSQQIIYSS